MSVPGEFIDPASWPFLACAPNEPFYTKVNKLSPFPTSHHKLPSLTAIPQSVRDARFVFIRHDGHRGPLRRPYDGPFRLSVSGDMTSRNHGWWSRRIHLNRPLETSSRRPHWTCTSGAASETRLPTTSTSRTNNPGDATRV